jgi:hypothetical protein
MPLLYINSIWVSNQPVLDPIRSGTCGNSQKKTPTPLVVWNRRPCSSKAHLIDPPPVLFVFSSSQRFIWRRPRGGRRRLRSDLVRRTKRLRVAPNCEGDKVGRKDGSPWLRDCGAKGNRRRCTVSSYILKSHPLPCIFNSV